MNPRTHRRVVVLRHCSFRRDIDGYLSRNMLSTAEDKRLRRFPSFLVIQVVWWRRNRFIWYRTGINIILLLRFFLLLFFFLQCTVRKSLRRCTNWTTQLNWQEEKKGLLQAVFWIAMSVLSRNQTHNLRGVRPSLRKLRHRSPLKLRLYVVFSNEIIFNVQCLYEWLLQNGLLIYKQSTLSSFCCLSGRISGKLPTNELRDGPLDSPKLIDDEPD